MDEYLAKPIRVKELVAKFSAVCSPRRPKHVRVYTPGSFPINWTNVLEFADLDPDLLGQLVETLIDELPNLRQDIQAAVDGRDAEQLERVIHTLKGEISFLNIAEANEVVTALETIAKSGDFDGVQAKLRRLGSIVDLLVTECRQFSRRSS
jgi:HPt (histidine-containing phosphotransfer) domain-containing protein